MACSFCENGYAGYQIFDDKNYPTNKMYLTCATSSVDSVLRLWKGDSYIGCYEIKYCPICGRQLKGDTEEVKHGHWYGVKHYQNKASGQCSECGKQGALRVSRDDWGIWYIDMPRCPDCGAIMDGKINYL